MAKSSWHPTNKWRLRRPMFSSFLMLLFLHNSLMSSSWSSSIVAVVVASNSATTEEQKQQQHQEEEEEEEEQQQQCSASSSSPEADDNNKRRKRKRKTYHHMLVLIHGYLGSSREQEYLGEALLHQLERITNRDDDDDDVLLSSSSSSFVDDTTTNDDDVNCQTADRKNHHHHPTHKFAILNSKANMVDSTDGIVKGGERLAVEITEWIGHQTDEVVRQHQQQQSESEEEESIIMTLSMVGNSLGGLYGRYALTELDHVFRNDNSSNNDSHSNNKNNNSNPPRIIPLIFCTTSSPHLGVSRETFVELPRWTEPYVSSVFRQQTMDDLFRVNDSTVVMDMCRDNDTNNSSDNDDDDDPSSSSSNNNSGGGDSSSSSNRSHREYLRPLRQFQKRIAVANAYNTDFLVSVSSGAFLSSKSDSIHYHPDSDVVVTQLQQQQSLSLRLMKDIEHVALQVVTLQEEDDDDDDDDAILPTTSSFAGRDKVKSGVDDRDHDHYRDDTSSCVNALDRLGWHKIFIDTRKLLPKFLNLPTPKLPEPNKKASQHKASHAYTSGDLQKHFQRYGTLLPIAHPLNMANCRTDWYRKLTKGGQPIVDALAELLVLDIIDLSEKIDQS